MGSPPEDVDHPGLYKWYILLAGFGCQLTAASVTQSVGMFYIIFKENIAGSNTVISLATSLNLGLMYGIGPIPGALTERFGYRRVAVSGCIVAVIGLLATIFVNDPWLLVLTFGVLTGIGIGVTYIPSITALSDYFVKNRSMAMGVAAAGLGTGHLVFPRLIQYFVDVFGWRGAILMVTGVYLHTFVFACLFRPTINSHRPKRMNNLKTTPKFVSETTIIMSGISDCQNSRSHVLKDINFDLFLMHAFLFAFGTSILFIHIGAHAVTLGFSDDQAAMLYLMIGLGSAITRLFYGVLAQIKCVGPLKPYIISQGLCAACTIIYPLCSSYLMLSACVTVIGVFYGSFGSLSPLIAIQLTSAAQIASAYGYVGVSCGAGFLAGGPIAAWLYNVTKYYAYSFFLGGGVMVMSVLLLIPVVISDECNKVQHQPRATLV